MCREAGATSRGRDRDRNAVLSPTETAFLLNMALALYSATNIVCRDVDVFGNKTVIINRIL
jgi:hypothetical protein